MELCIIIKVFETYQSGSNGVMAYWGVKKEDISASIIAPIRQNSNAPDLKEGYL